LNLQVVNSFSIAKENIVEGDNIERDFMARTNTVIKIIYLLVLFCNMPSYANDSVVVSDGRYFQYIIPLADHAQKSQQFYNGKLLSEEESEPVIWTAIKSSFALPFDELLKKKHPSEWRNLISGFSGGLSVGFPLTKSNTLTGEGREGDLSTNNISYSASLKYKPLGNWFISAAVIEYKTKELQKPWNPDFVYTFGYSDWRPYTVSLVYANYGGNRLNPNRKENEKATIFKQGAWLLGWKFPVPAKYSKYITFSESGRVGCNIGLSIVPEYFDAKASEYKKWKKTLSLGCKYTIFGPWYVNFTAFHYINKSQQQPWNPDYTYGFGYFDWQPGTITVQYNNYSGNRWRGRDAANGTGVFKSGGISISWSWSF